MPPTAQSDTASQTIPAPLLPSVLERNLSVAFEDDTTQTDSVHDDHTPDTPIVMVECACETEHSTVGSAHLETHACQTDDDGMRQPTSIGDCATQTSMEVPNNEIAHTHVDGYDVGSQTEFDAANNDDTPLQPVFSNSACQTCDDEQSKRTDAPPDTKMTEQRQSQTSPVLFRRSTPDDTVDACEQTAPTDATSAHTQTQWDESSSATLVMDTSDYNSDDTMLNSCTQTEFLDELRSMCAQTSYESLVGLRSVAAQTTHSFKWSTLDSDQQATTSTQVSARIQHMLSYVVGTD
jgi:hypothetical protein